MARSIEEQTGVDPGSLEPEVTQEPPATEDTRPEWLDERFGTPEDLAKSYKELEGRFTQSQQQYRQIEHRLEALAEAQEQQPREEPQFQGQTSLVRQYEEAIESGDTMTQLGIIAFLAQQAVKEQQPQQTQPDESQAQIFAALAEQQVAARFGDEWEALKPEVGQLLSEHPHLLPDTGDLGQTVESLYLAGEMIRARKGQNAQQQVDAGRQMKLGAQGMSGASGRPDQAQVSAADHLKSLMQNIR